MPCRAGDEAASSAAENCPSHTATDTAGTSPVTSPRGAMQRDEREATTESRPAATSARSSPAGSAERDPICRRRPDGERRRCRSPPATSLTTACERPVDQSGEPRTAAAREERDTGERDRCGQRAEVEPMPSRRRRTHEDAEACRLELRWKNACVICSSRRPAQRRPARNAPRSPRAEPGREHDEQGEQQKPAADANLEVVSCSRSSGRQRVERSKPTIVTPTAPQQREPASSTSFDRRRRSRGEEEREQHDRLTRRSKPRRQPLPERRLRLARVVEIGRSRRSRSRQDDRISSGDFIRPPARSPKPTASASTRRPRSRGREAEQPPRSCAKSISSRRAAKEREPIRDSTVTGSSAVAQPRRAADDDPSRISSRSPQRDARDASASGASTADARDHRNAVERQLHYATDTRRTP